MLSRSLRYPIQVILLTAAYFAAEKMFGFTREEMIGHNVSLLMHSPEREQHDGNLARYAQTRERKIIGHGREVRGRRKDGTIFPVDLSVSETQMQDHCIFTGILRDATLRHQRVQAEKDLAAAHEKLDLARKIQESYFPSVSPVVPGFNLAGASYPADETGGDYYDYFPWSAGRIGIVVADVSGHGIGPALESLDATSLPLGVAPWGIPGARPRTLQSGQMVLFVTDGVAETESPDGRHRSYQTRHSSPAS